MTFACSCQGTVHLTSCEKSPYYLLEKYAENGSYNDVMLARILAHVVTIEAEVMALKFCSCGKPLTPGICTGSCDNDE